MSSMKETQKASNACLVITPEFRVSYPYVFEPRTKDGEGKTLQKPEYAVQMIFRVGPNAQGQIPEGEKVVSLKGMQDAAMAAAVEKWGPDQAKWPKPFRIPFRMGDEEGMADKDGYGKGVVFVGAKSDYQPGVIDQNKADVLDKRLVYPGCYMRAQVCAYPWMYMGKSGVSFGLRHLQIVRDGEPLGNRTRAEDAFGALPLPDGGAAGAGAVMVGAPAPATGGGNPFGGLS